MAGEITEFPNARSSGTGGGHKQARAPRIKVKSVPGKPLKIDMEPNDAVRLLSTFGTAEAGFANLMLSGIINAACSKRPGSEDVNATLAAITGIEACDEVEGDARHANGSNAFSCDDRFASAQELRKRCSAGQ